MSDNQTLDQRRAAHAWEAIRGLPKDSNGDYSKEAKDYAREARKLPARILTAGLGPALAFLLAKAKREKKDKKQETPKEPILERLHKNLTAWVIKERGIQAKVEGSLLESVIKGDSDFLMQATDEALAYLQWLVRFAEAEGLTKDEGEVD